MHLFARIVPALLAALLLAAPATAQDAQDLPDAASLFEKHIEAIGGHDAIAKHHDRTLYGDYRVLETGEVQLLTIYSEAPNRMRAELTAPAVGSTIRCTDGQTAWGVNTTGAPFELAGRDREELMDSANFKGEADYKNLYESYTTANKITVDGNSAWRVDVVSKSGLKGAVYFDVETGLVMARQIFPTDVQANNDTLIVVSDYKDFDGVLLPTKQRHLLGEKLTPVIETEFRWIKINTGEMPEFDPPASISRNDDAG